MSEVQIFFDDLSTAKQKELLKANKIKSEKEMNWDVMPITIIEVEE